MNPAGAVLAGGASRRMGVDKAYLAVAGLAMIERVAGAMRAAGVDPVVAIGGDPGRNLDCGLTTIADGWPGQGPLGGILTALAWSPAPFVVVAACDLPSLDPQTFRAILEHPDDDADVVAAGAGRPEPLCARWRVATCEGDLLQAFVSGERSVHRAWTSLRRAHRVRPALEFRNMNTPDDLASA